MLLDGPATPGIIGALRDWLRGIIGTLSLLLRPPPPRWSSPRPTLHHPPCPCPLPAGTRLLLPAVIAASLHQPPLAVLAQQLLHLYLAVDVRGACAAPLLRDPLSLRRLGGAWELLDAASVMGVPLASAISTHQGAQGGWVRGRAGGARGSLARPTDAQPPAVRCGLPTPAGDEARCHAVVAFHVQLIALLPVAVAARASQQPQQQEPDLPPVARHGGGAAGLARRGLQHVAQACCQLDAQLGSVFRGGGMLPLQCCVVAYLAVGNMWLLAKALS